MNDVIVSEVNENIVLTININELDNIDFDNIELFLFSKKTNDFKEIAIKEVDVLGIKNQSNSVIEYEKLTFIEKYFTHIKKIILSKYSYEDITVLYQLKNLENFKSTGLIKTKFDFNKLLTLKNVFIEYSENLSSIFNCNKLKELEIHKFPEKKSSKFKGLTNLKKLVLRQFKMMELQEIGELQYLEYLEISHNRTINSLASLNQNKSIKELHIMNCPKIKDFSSLSALKNLEILTIDNQKEIPSLDFIKEMPNLKDLAIIGSSNVIDGKLKWLLDKENFKLVCEIKKHYDIKWSKGKDDNFIIVSK